MSITATRYWGYKDANDLSFWFTPESGSANFDGPVYSGSTQLTSDIKFKENITAAGPQLDDIVKLGGMLKNWNWKEEAPNRDKETRFLGLIAQEAETVSPGLVEDVPLDEEANREEYKSLKTDVLLMKLLGAVAEQNAVIEGLRAEIEELKKGS